MKQHDGSNRRSYGSGSITIRNGAYYGKWRAGGQQIKRKLGPVRQPGTRSGLTKAQAEGQLRKLMAEVSYTPPAARLSFREVAERYLDHVQAVRQRKTSTVSDYRSMLNAHLDPYFGSRAIERITADEIASYMALKGRTLKPKTILNHRNFAHGVFAYAVKRKLVASNPVAEIDRPSVDASSPDFRFLDAEQLAAVLRAVPGDTLGAMEGALYRVAVMTGLRQGELVALRWRDVDWTARKVRVRQNYTRGEWGTPKSRRSTRTVPLADTAAAALEQHSQRSLYQGDDDLVFGHPHTGRPYDASKMRKRFYDAMRGAGLGHRVGQANGITFHSLRHTYGTRMAAVGVPMRTLQEWMGHKDFATTLKYADYAPDPAQGAAFAELAFGAASAQYGPSAAGATSALF